VVGREGGYRVILQGTAVVQGDHIGKIVVVVEGHSEKVDMELHFDRKWLRVIV
jgi:hypothetical protein